MRNWLTVVFLSMSMFFLTSLVGVQGEDILIAIDIAGITFSDPGPIYAAAVTAAGHTVVDTIFAPEEADIPWPVPFTSNEYDAVFLLTADNWWGDANAISPADEAAMAAYLDTGGNALVVGQDMLWGAHPTWGAASGFFNTHLGLASVTQDTANNVPTQAGWGYSGTILDGVTFTARGMDGGGFFLSNNLYTDTLTPATNASALIGGTGADPCGISYDSGSFKTVFSTIEIGSAIESEFNPIMATILGWFFGGSVPTPTAVPPTPTSIPPTPTVVQPTPTGVQPTPTNPACNNDGDVNLDGTITAEDAQLTFAIVLGFGTPTFEELCAADCNGSGDITAEDAQWVFAAALGQGECADPV